MKIVEMFKSIQGEGVWVGYLCSFIRVAGCNLSCVFCDTKYARKNGKEIGIEEIMRWSEKERVKRIVITGGEPLLQEEIYLLIERLIKSHYLIAVETNGSIGVEKLPPEVIKILDVKCPSSGMESRMRYENFKSVTRNDKIKFVLSNLNDYRWAKTVIEKFNLHNKGEILFTPVNGNLTLLKDIAKWVMEDNLEVKLQLQLHKCIGIK